MRSKIFCALALSAFLFACGSSSDKGGSSDDGKEKTLAIIKPDAVRSKNIGAIITQYEGSGLNIAAIKMVHLDKTRAGDFYSVHKGRPFYGELVDFMSSGPVVAIVLEGEDAIAKNRELMGATDPAEAKEGTLRKRFASSKGQNAVHGSDSPKAAREEIFFFFSPEELMSSS